MNGCSPPRPSWMGSGVCCGVMLSCDELRRRGNLAGGEPRPDGGVGMRPGKT
jgi:hypothetical protein